MAYIESPIVPPASPLQVMARAYPLERRVIRRLVQGLSVITDALDSGQSAQAFQGPPTLNGNMCEAILGMKPRGDALLEFDVSWSSAWPMPETPKARTHFSYQPCAFDTIDSLARGLREHYEPIPKTYTGRVVRLASDNPGNRSAFPKAVLRVETPDAPRTVQLALNPADYRKACDAHRDGAKVDARGILDREGKKWVLLEVSSFAPVRPAGDAPA